MTDTPQQANYGAQLMEHLERRYATPGYIINGPSRVHGHVAAHFNGSLLDGLASKLYTLREVPQVTGGTRTFASFPRLDELLKNADTDLGLQNLAEFFASHLPAENASKLAELLSEDMMDLKARREEFNVWMQREAELEASSKGPKGGM